MKSGFQVRFALKMIAEFFLVRERKNLLPLPSVKTMVSGRVASPKNSGKTTYDKEASSFKTIVNQYGLLAEWLGSGLQNRVRRFESARDLPHITSDAIDSFALDFFVSGEANTPQATGVHKTEK